MFYPIIINMKRFALLVLGIGAVVFVRGQSISPEVLGSAGDEGTVGTTTVAWTIGEPVVETIATGANQLSQGFHQPRYLLVGLEPLGPLGLEVDVYPNPAENHVYFDFSRESELPLAVDLIDMNGRVLQTRQSDLQAERLSFDLSNVAIGNYYLRLRQEGAEEVKAYKVQKVH